MSSVRHRIGSLLVAGSALGWSLGGLFTRLIHVDSWTMAAWRGVFGALGLAIVIPLLGQQGMWRRLRSTGLFGWLFVLQAAAGMICYLAALRHTSVANVAVIYATAPFLAGGLAWLVMREKPTASSMFASLVALMGVALMVGFGGVGNWLGDALALGMTAMMAFSAVVARNIPDIPILLTACLSSLLSGLVSWPLGAPLSVSRYELMLLAVFGIVNFAVALPLYTLGARQLPAIETALIGALDAPLAPFWVWLLLGEVPTRSTFVGGTIVFAAVAIHFMAAESQAGKAPLSGGGLGA